MGQGSPVARSFSPRSLHTQIVRHVGLGILRGDVRPGDALPSEPDFCVQLSVSRIALREALKVLASKGLVESRPKTGTRVRPRDDWNLLDPEVLVWLCESGPDRAFLRNLSEVRLAIEPMAARLAATRATAEQIDDLDAWYRRMWMAIEDTEAFIGADLEFHTALLSAAHNELLLRMGGTIGAALRASREVTTRLPSSSEAAMPLHGAVIEAIRARDERASEGAMSALIVGTMADIERALRPPDPG